MGLGACLLRSEDIPQPDYVLLVPVHVARARRRALQRDLWLIASAGSSTRQQQQREYAATPLGDESIDYFVSLLSDPDCLRGSFEWYRALDATIAQDERRKTQRLTGVRPGDRSRGELR